MLMFWPSYHLLTPSNHLSLPRKRPTTHTLNSKPLKSPGNASITLCGGLSTARTNGSPPMEQFCTLPGGSQSGSQSSHPVHPGPFDTQALATATAATTGDFVDCSRSSWEGATVTGTNDTWPVWLLALWSLLAAAVVSWGGDCGEPLTGTEGGDPPDAGASAVAMDGRTPRAPPLLLLLSLAAPFALLLVVLCVLVPLPLFLRARQRHGKRDSSRRSGGPGLWVRRVRGRNCTRMCVGGQTLLLTFPACGTYASHLQTYRHVGSVEKVKCYRVVQRAPGGRRVRVVKGEGFLA